jgi:hypothetical protein
MPRLDGSVVNAGAEVRIHALEFGLVLNRQFIAVRQHTGFADIVFEQVTEHRRKHYGLASTRRGNGQGVSMLFQGCYRVGDKLFLSGSQ